MTAEPHVAVAETHTGAVLFLGDLAYKVKKPVALGFVDWTRRDDRVVAIETEFALNRRLAPDVYLGTGLLPRPSGDDEPVLIMRRLPAERRLSTLVRRGEDVDDVLRHLAHQLAAFHLATDVTAAAVTAASPTETRARWEQNHARLRPFFGRWVDDAIAHEVLEGALRYLDGRTPLLDARVDHGRARDGHGDLLADDVFCLDDGPRVLDCLDFDERLRVGDMLADVAFLAMDLERLGRPDLGWRMLRLHREMAGDTWPDSLAHHYVAYRAHVRALVSCVRADQGDVPAGAQAGELLALAADHVRSGRIRLVLVGGSPGTGKSTLAAALGDALAAPVLRSDEVRKELAGLAPSDRSAAAIREGIYSAEWTDRTYAELLVRAGQLLAHGDTVVLDATWGRRGDRNDARALAERHRADAVELRCRVADDVAVARAGARAAAGRDASDADVIVAAQLAASFDPWPEAHTVGTAADPEAALAAAIDALDAERSPGSGIGS